MAHDKDRRGYYSHDRQCHICTTGSHIDSFSVPYLCLDVFRLSPGQVDTPVIVLLTGHNQTGRRSVCQGITENTLASKHQPK